MAQRALVTPSRAPLEKCRNRRAAAALWRRVRRMSTTRWEKLIDYYRSCVAVENTAEARFEAANDGRDFVHVRDEECISSGTGFLVFGDEDESFRSFMRNSRWDKASPTYFYGFPCLEGRFIQPLIIFDVEETQSQEGRVFTVQPGRPRINAAGLPPGERQYAATALNECWDESKPLPTNVDAALEELQAVLPGVDRDALLRNPSGALFRAVDSVYTRGLEQELGRMAEGSSANEVCKLLLDRNGGPVEEGSLRILEITPLNEEQRAAVKSAFVNALTVVTGPPGTGKSQVVLNVIANALLRGETVLFSSKNRQAVNVVVERLSEIQSQPIVLKYGGEETPTFASRLLQALDRASSRSAGGLNREISERANEIVQLHREEEQARLTLERIVDRRNRIQKIEVDLEGIQAELPGHIAKNLRAYDKRAVGKPFHRQLTAAEQLLEEMERPSLMTLARSLIGQSIEKRMREAAQSLLAAMPEHCAGLAVASMEDCRESTVAARTLTQWVDQQRELLDLADKNWREPRVEVLHARIAHSRGRAIEVSVTQADALAQRRLMNLTPVQRRAASDYATLLRALGNNYGGDDIRQELRRASGEAFQEGVAEAFPAIAVTNLSVRHAVPLAGNAVDLVVIDEASQCDIASALPVLHRGKRALVIGDPNQLRHISHLRPADDARLLSNAGLHPVGDQRFAYSGNSLFDLARTVVGSGARFTELREHYRSRAEIIDFSNKEFYGDYMSVETDYGQRPLVSSTGPVAWRDVQGETVRPPNGGAFNDAEAQAVVNLIEEIAGKTADRPELRPSLGVVTPFRQQANRIQNLVESSIDAAELQRLEFTADTAHRYQGDEKDIVVFSPVISRNARDSAVRFVGSAPNLFNVAITRARSELHVVGDMTACAGSGIPFLARFVSYVEWLRAGRPTEDASGPFESQWEKVFFEALKNAGVSCLPQYRFDQYKLDLAIPDERIDIEIDGEVYHRNPDGGQALSDLRRDTRLASRGWRVKRFWVYELKSDLDRCVREVQELLANEQRSETWRSAR